VTLVGGGLGPVAECCLRNYRSCEQREELQMPAVTVDDTLSLPKVAEPQAGETARERPVLSISTAPKGLEGEGFPVRRAFAGVDLARLDPFIHLDQMGEVEYAPGEPKGTPWHPHRGFETVTYMIDGTFQHRDSTGGGGLITNGDTQWMTAGAGILHIETPPEELVASGGLFHGLQLWVNLPAAAKWSSPRYQDIRSQGVQLLASPDGGALVRIIAGEMPVTPAEGDADAGAVTLAGPGSTHTPITMLHATLAPGAQVRLPWREDFNALAYVLSGQGSVGAEARSIGEGQLAVFGPGEVVTVAAAESGPDSRTPELEVLLLGGTPLREPVAWHGPFVMNTRAEIVEALDDFQHGRMGQIPS
jgi:redox-sensitive bicupin YhaK (pirin superfamily)